MTVEFYDLAQRLYADQSGAPVLKVAGSLFQVSPQAIFVDAHQDANGAVVATVGTAAGSPVTGKGCGCCARSPLPVPGWIPAGNPFRW